MQKSLDIFPIVLFDKSGKPTLKVCNSLFILAASPGKSTL